MNKDLEHLKLLSIFHYVYAGLTALFSSIPIIHVIVGLVFILAPDKMTEPGGQEPPAFLGWFFAIFGSAIILIGWTIAILRAIAGRCLARRRAYWYCFVIAILDCLSIPLGTVLGVFTLIVLVRPTVKALFGVAAPGVPPSAVASP